MNRSGKFGLLIMISVLLSPVSIHAAPSTAASERKIECFVLVELGASAEGNEVFIRNMGFDPEIMRSFAPSRFEVGAEGFRVSSEGAYSYQSESPNLVEKTGKIALYSMRARIKAPSPPNPQKTVKVEMRLADLAAKGTIVQPGLRAIELGARQLGWTSGRAWVIEMKRTGAGKLQAVVGFAR
jgi:hypothetical protein